ncbi:MAG: hypothetical protein HC843_02910 [Sphingomonadales bacterium]|nr:hypothetical protein [Sphingomonadales bacterium]
MSNRESATILIQNFDGRSEPCDLKFEVSHYSEVMKSETPTFGQQIWHGNDAFHALELFRRKSNHKDGEHFAMGLGRMLTRQVCAAIWREGLCYTLFRQAGLQL